jgi:thioredoxin 1
MYVKRIVQILEELEPGYAEILGFYYVHVEEHPALYQRFSLKGVPQILFFKDGEYQGKLSDKVKDDPVEEKIFELYKLN